jgi:hypothetical protein
MKCAMIVLILLELLELISIIYDTFRCFDAYAWAGTDLNASIDASVNKSLNLNLSKADLNSIGSTTSGSASSGSTDISNFNISTPSGSGSVNSDLDLGLGGGSDSAASILELAAKGDPSDLNKGYIIASIIMEFLVILPIVYAIYVFGAYLFKAQPKSKDRLKLVYGLKVLLIKAVVIRNIAAILMY